jgi:capsular exopolysaccharide synthesis family protein
MSRIFDALKQTENPIIRMIENEQGGQAAVFGEEPPAEAPEAMEALVQDFAPAAVSVPPPDVVGYGTTEIRARVGSPVLPFDDTDRRTAECYRILRTNLVQHPARPRVFSITSAGSGEGKTTSAINIAGALALKEDSRVLLVDADLRRGSVALMLGIDPSPGLAEILSGQCRVEEAIVQTENLTNLYVLPAGESQSNPVELLDSDSWKELILSLREQFQFVVVDSTPVGIVADNQLVQAVCDGTIMIVRPDFTDRNDYATAMQYVTKGKFLGVLLNCVEDWLLWQARDYYGYGGKK